jgi:septin 7
MDVKVMSEIGKHVPIIPIVTKADTMSSREASTYRSDVATKLSNPMLPGERSGGRAGVPVGGLEGTG